MWLLSLFGQGVRVQNILEAGIADRGHACVHEVSESQNFGTRIGGPPPPFILRFFRVPKYWDTEFGPFLFAQPDAWQDATVAEILPTRYRRGNDLGVPKVGDRTRGLPKRLFVQCVRVPDLWDTELTLAETLVFTRVSVSQHFGTRNLGQVPRLFLRITRVPRLWLTTLDHDYQDNDPAFI